MLRWATLDGAKVAGIADRTGSITPGKKADLVIIDTKARQRRAGHRPGRGRRLRGGHLERRTVLVDGRIVKDDFRLVAELDAAAAGRRGVA